MDQFPKIKMTGRGAFTPPKFLVVCDETNNTPEVVARNELVATIHIQREPSDDDPLSLTGG